MMMYPTADQEARFAALLTDEGTVDRALYLLEPYVTPLDVYQAGDMSCSDSAKCAFGGISEVVANEILKELENR